MRITDNRRHHWTPKTVAPQRLAITNENHRKRPAAKAGVAVSNPDGALEFSQLKASFWPARKHRMPQACPSESGGVVSANKRRTPFYGPGCQVPKPPKDVDTHIRATPPGDTAEPSGPGHGEPISCTLDQLAVGDQWPKHGQARTCPSEVSPKIGPV